MKYPLGIQSFESLRESDYAYVDKTQFVYDLTHLGKYYFLSRPRWFGKSLQHDKGGLLRETARKLRGYFFHPSAMGVYNPYSQLNTLSRREFRDYWFETGTPTYIVKVMQRHPIDIDQMVHAEATADLLGSLDSLDRNPLPLIYQSGYLTIKDYDAEFGNYILGFPNKEVERGFTKFLLQSDKTFGELENWIMHQLRPQDKDAQLPDREMAERIIQKP